MKIAVVLFNLGGPSDERAIRPFLFNLFSDPAIISLPFILRIPLAYYLSYQRERKARAIYSYLGGRSLLLENTKKQAVLLQHQLGKNYKVFVCMRYWHPRAKEVTLELAEYKPDQIVLLPLYPQFSYTTTGSSLREFNKYLPGFCYKTIDYYPQDEGFISAQVDLIQKAFQSIKGSYRLLFTAHGLPQRKVLQGDPYESHIHQTVQAIVAKLSVQNLDYQLCYQSRVGRLAWLKPYTEDEILKAANENKTLIIVPISFVSENSETLVELDVQYKEFALKQGAIDYVRVQTVSEHDLFIKGLADLVRNKVWKH